MANEVFKGLFGFSPDELTRQREAENEARAFKLAQLDPLQQAGFQAFNAASGIRDSVKDIGRSLFNIEDPQMKDASLMDSAFNQVNQSGVDPTSAAGLQQIGQLLTQQGASPRALERLSAAYQQAQMREAKLASEQALTAQRSREGKANLPSEVQIAQMLNDPNVPDEVKKSLRDQVFREKAQNSPEFIKLLDARDAAPEGSERRKQLDRLIESEITGRATRGKTELTVNQPVPPSAKKIGETAGSEIGKAVAGIGSQEEIIRNSQRALKLLDDGIYAGPYAEAQQVVAKFTRGAVGDIDKVVRTEQFQNTIRNNVIPLLVAFGGNDSNEEKQFLERLVGGEIKAEPAAIRAAVESGMRKAEANIAKLRSQINAAETGQSLSTTISNQADPLGLFPQQGKK